MGSVAVPHGIGNTVQLLGGNYTIRDSTVFFEIAPYGNTPIGTTTGGPDNIDWTGITTRSTFQGRTFMRSDNLPLKRILTQITTPLTTFNRVSMVSGMNLEFSPMVKISTVSQPTRRIILNSNILQEPQGVQFSTGDVELTEETAGITSIRYTGVTESIGYDGSDRVFLEGILISAASTGGFGISTSGIGWWNKKYLWTRNGSVC